MKPQRTEANRTEAGQLGAPSPIVCPPELFAFRIGPRVALTFGVLWGMLGGRPGSLRISSAAVAGVLCCDARCVRDAIETLVAIGLLERSDHSGLVYSLRVNDPRTLAVARRIIEADAQAALFDSEGDPAEIPAQEIPRLHVHVGNKSLTCHEHEGPEIPAQKIPPAATVRRLGPMLRPERPEGEPLSLGAVLTEAAGSIGAGGSSSRAGAVEAGAGYHAGGGVVVRGVEGLAAELRRRVGDPDAAPQLFGDVAQAITEGRIDFDRVKGLIRDIDEGSRQGRVRRRGAVFRAEVRKMLGE